MYDIAIIFIIFLLLFLLVYLTLSKPKSIVLPPFEVGTKVQMNLPSTASPVGVVQPYWVSKLMSGDRIPFGSYDLQVKDGMLYVNDIDVFRRAELMSATPYSVYFKDISFYRGSPFIQTSPEDIDPKLFYISNGFIWLKLDLPDFYGKLYPYIPIVNISISDSEISSTFESYTYMWIPKRLAKYYANSENVLFEMDHYILIYTHKFSYNFITHNYDQISNSNTRLYDQLLKYDVSNGQIIPRRLVANLVKRTFDMGIPTNQAQLSRLKMLVRSLFNRYDNEYFSILAALDLYELKLVDIDQEMNLTEALSILGYTTKWNILGN